MKTFSSPIPAPPFNVRATYAQARAEEADYIAAVATALRGMGWVGPLTGEVVRFPIADGYALYMVAEPPPKTRGAAMSLVHLPLGDAWAIPAAHARGLRKADIVKMVAQRRSIEKLFPATPLGA